MWDSIRSGPQLHFIYRRIREIVHDVNAKVPLYKKIRRIEVRENDFIKTTN